MEYYEYNFNKYLESLNEDKREEISNIIEYIRNVDYNYFLYYVKKKLK